MHSGTLHLADDDIYYEIHGRGDPLLVLHGGMASLREWDAIVPMLAESFQVVAYDRAGVGRSGGRPFQRDIVANGADELERVIKHFGFERVRLFGSCIGGAIALRLAAQSKVRVRSLVTTGVLFRGSVELRQRLATVFRAWTGMPRQFQETLRRVYGGNGVETSYETFRQMYAKAEPVGYASSPDYDIRAELPGVTCPVLTVHGDRDPFWGVEQPASAYHLMPNAALWVLPRCAHYPHVEYPQIVAAQAAAFFREN
jgi:pimeloyl-ACP methyl ester carboxylesterase